MNIKLRSLLIVAVFVGLLWVARSAQAVSSDLVISQVYGGGGNTGATYKNDFIELFNRGAAPVSVTGWTVQYASSSGTSWSQTLLTGTLAPGQYFLVQEAQGTGGTVDLPTPDAVGSIAMSATNGKVALVNNSTTLSGSCPTGLIDLIGYGTANCSEGAAAPGLSNTTADLRSSGGCVDTDSNSADFTAGAPNPRNTAAPLNVCGGDLAPTVSSTTPANNAVGVALNANLSITFSEPVNVIGSWFDISCANSGDHTASVSGGPVNFTLDPSADFTASETCTVTVFASQVTDQDSNDPPDNMAADYVWHFTAAAPPAFIHDIQGASHISPLNGQPVSNVPGIVTAKRSNGFYLQDPNPDSNEATSEGIFVFTSSAPTVNVGDSVLVSGNVSEFRSGGSSGLTNLTTTELTSPSITVVSSGNPLPAPVIIGTGGRVPPNTVIEDDATGDVETSGVFDPANDGIDFYESLEGMRVQVNDAVAVGPWHDFTSNREIPVIGDNGANAGLRTARGGIIIQAGDFNPERIILNDLIVGGPTLPSVNVSDSFPGAIVGVMDYSFGNFKLEVSQLPAPLSGGLAQEVTAPSGVNQLAAATFNVENLAPSDPITKFQTLASLIVNNLRAPDVIAIEEIQDNSGATDDGVVDASTTWSLLISAIQSAGGPTYDYRQINPVNDQDGGQPGGNIRQGFLFRTDRGLSFVDRPGGDSTTATTIINGSNGPELSFSPGRIDPTNSAFNTSRKPLAGEFMYNGHHLFVIANHFDSKGGDDPLFGHFQPPVLSSAVQRVQQAQIVHDFVGTIESDDPAADLVVLGDLNDFEFSTPVLTLDAGVLTDLITTLPPTERYSYVFDGNSQTLDHILLSNDLFNTRPFAYDVVHVNSEFANQASDHEPQVVHVTLNDPPTANAGGPYSVNEGSSVLVTATGSDPESGPLTFAWDLDNNGTFETPGQSVTFSAATLDGPGSHTIKVQVTDNGGLSTVAQTTVDVLNVAPTVDVPAVAAEPSIKGSAATASATFNDPAGVGDAPYTCVINYGDGSGNLAGTVSGNTCTGPAHSYAAVGAYTVSVSVSDKDGGTGSNSVTHSVIYNFTGFFAPVMNPPAFNVVNAGRTIALKFSLSGNQGLSIFAAGYPLSQSISCGSAAPTIGDAASVAADAARITADAARITADAGRLTYNARTNQYTFVWQTNRTWSGTCRQLIMQLNDGTFHVANFQFR